MQRNKKEIEKALRKKGFEEKKTHHTIFKYVSLDGKKYNGIKTRTSHGNGSKSLSSSRLGEMAKQCKLTKEDFLNLIDCTLSQEDYEKILKENKDI